MHQRFHKRLKLSCRIERGHAVQKNRQGFPSGREPIFHFITLRGNLLGVGSQVLAGDAIKTGVVICEGGGLDGRSQVGIGVGVVRPG